MGVGLHALADVMQSLTARLMLTVHSEP